MHISAYECTRETLKKFQKRNINSATLKQYKYRTFAFPEMEKAPLTFFDDDGPPSVANKNLLIPSFVAIICEINLVSHIQLFTSVAIQLRAIESSDFKKGQDFYFDIKIFGNFQVYL